MAEQPTALNVKQWLHQIKGIAIGGISRALIFSKFGLSGQYCADDIKSYKGKNTVSMNVVCGYEIQPENLDVYKKNYLDWILLNGIREIVENFYIFIDELIVLFSLVNRQEKTRLYVRDHIEICNKIKTERKSLTEKLTFMKREFNLPLESDYRTHILFFEKVRHCITHNLGIVTKKYFKNAAKGGKTALIEWLELKLITIDNTQKEKVVKLGEPVKGEGGLYLKAFKYRKEIPYNTLISINFDELEMIAFTTLRIVEGFSESCKNFCDSKIS